VPDWVRRLLVSCAFLFGTWSGVLAVADDDYYSRSLADYNPALAPLALLAAMAATVAFTFRRLRDVYPLAVVLGSFLIVSLFWIGDAVEMADEGVFLLLAVYLIGVSTAGGKVLLTLMRRWRAPVPA
jgi:hypothetical protein